MEESAIDGHIKSAWLHTWRNKHTGHTLVYTIVNGLNSEETLPAWVGGEDSN